MILLDPNLEPELDHTPRRPAASARASRLSSVRTFARFLAQAQTAVRLRGEVNVLLTTDQNIRALNRRFRGKNKATDVLSFPADTLVQKQEKGDLAISVPTARKQSIACGHSLGTEIKVLILHGLLHLAGYDHETDDGQMARREQKLRARLGLPQGLIERAMTATISPKKRPKDGAQRQKATAGLSARPPAARPAQDDSRKVAAQDDKRRVGIRSRRRKA